MRKLCVVSLSVLMIAGAGTVNVVPFISEGLPVSAAEVTSDGNFIFEYLNNNIEITNYIGSHTDIVIPDELKRSDKVFTNPEREYTKCGYLETPRFLYFVNTNYGANLMMAFTDKTTWTTYRMYVYTAEFNEDKMTREPFPFLVSSYNGTLVGFYDSGMIMDNERFRSLFPKMNEDSNPVLLFFREN